RTRATLRRPNLGLEIVDHVIRNAAPDRAEVCRGTHLRHQIILDVCRALFYYRRDVGAQPRINTRKIGGQLTGALNFDAETVSHLPYRPYPAWLRSVWRRAAWPSSTRVSCRAQ